MADAPTCTYVTYIHGAPEAVWAALTEPELTTAYWAHRNLSDWTTGSEWTHERIDGSGIIDTAGTVVHSTPPTRLVLTWANPEDGTAVAGATRARTEPGRPAGPSRVSFDIEPHGEIVRLTVTHIDLADEAERNALAAGWAAVLSNLKSFLETGHPLPQPPWQMLPGFVRK
jgi:uncharacterized protein YndB with AHSA1/START domain